MYYLNIVDHQYCRQNAVHVQNKLIGVIEWPGHREIGMRNFQIRVFDPKQRYRTHVHRQGKLIKCKFIARYFTWIQIGGNISLAFILHHVITPRTIIIIFL